MMAPILTATHDSSTSLSVVDTASSAQTFNGGRILVDESRSKGDSEIWVPGNASFFGWILGEYGFNMSMNWDETLDSGILDDYDILCLFFPQGELSSGEITAIQDFVSAGGGLLVVGVEHSDDGWAYSPTYLNPLSQTYGITFNEDDEVRVGLRSAGQIEDHHLTQSVESVGSRNGYLSGGTITAVSPAVTLVTINEKDFIAYANSGSGRVVAVGSGAPFLKYRHDAGSQVDPDDHFQFTLNVMDWLIGNAPREVEVPDLAIINVGNGPDLNSTEVDEYEVFSGVIHQHTTASDGSSTPTEMAIRALELGLDYFVVTDHSYDTPAANGIIGGLQVKSYTDRYGLDVVIVVGAEISRTPHMIGFPMTENIFTADIQVAIDGIHAQGGIAILSHATLSPRHCSPLSQCEEYGYDAVDIIDDSFFHGEGELAYRIPFIGADDTHDASNLGSTRNVLFVKNPTGPDGTISSDDILDAILNKRIVILDHANEVVIGQKVWVDRVLDLYDEAEISIENARTQIDSLESTGISLQLAKTYLTDAERFLENRNPSRALKAASDATSDLVLGIDITTVGRTLGVLEPSEDVTVSLNMTNRLGYGLSLNATPFMTSAITFDQSSMILGAGAGMSEIVDFAATTDDYGYSSGAFYLTDFNSTYKPLPVLVNFNGFVPQIEITEDLVDGGHEVTVLLYRQSRDFRHISSVILNYDVGEGTQTIQMENYGNGYGIVLGPLSGGTNITIEITLTDNLGNVFVIDGGIYAIEEDETAPDLVVPIIIGGAVAAVVVVVLVIRTRFRPG
ncbi:MAG: hypothetical protein ACW992_05970 [Candidatus Thorarchaeota archaeon]|jgi:hypothetical protein